MKRTSSNSADGSLDLLLDTICNTFGGVLFISLLVVVLLNLTSDQAGSEPPEPESQLELVELQLELSQAQHQLETQRAASQQRQQTAGSLVSEEQLTIAREIQELEERISEQIELKADTLESISRAQIEINETTQEMQEQESRLEEVRDQLEAINTELDGELGRRSRNVTLPKLEQTNKSYTTFFLKDGYLTSRFVISGGIQTDNVAEVAAVQEGATTYLDPKPRAGIAINPDQPNIDAIKARIQMFGRERYVIRVWIWPESFTHFAAVQESLVSLGYQYKPEPLKTTQRISIGGSPGPTLGQ